MWYIAEYMKLSDRPEAKLEHWASHPRPVRLPRIANLPRFTSQKFDSYEAFNAWKQELIRTLIRSGGARWTR